MGTSTRTGPKGSSGVFPGALLGVFVPGAEDRAGYSIVIAMIPGVQAIIHSVRTTWVGCMAKALRRQWYNYLVATVTAPGRDDGEPSKMVPSFRYRLASVIM